MKGPKKRKEHKRRTHLSATGSEETRLEREWDEDIALDHLLDDLPRAPVSSNFTAQVVQLIDQERNSRRSRWADSWWSYWPAVSFARKLAVTSLMVTIGLFAYYEYQISVRQELARSVVAVGNVASLPTLDMLEHFEAIRRLNLVPQEVDFELLAALQ